MTKRSMSAAAIVVSLLFGSCSTATHLSKPIAMPKDKRSAVAVAVEPSVAASLQPVAQLPQGELAVPILLYHRIGRPHRPFPELWVDARRLTAQLTAIADSGAVTLTIAQLDQALARKQTFSNGAIAITFDDASEDQYAVAFPILRRLHLRATFFVPTVRIGAPGWLTWPQIIAMHRSGLIEIAAHTLTHADLPAIPLDQAQQEIVQSKAELESKLNVPVSDFAYPFGHFNKKVEQLVKQAGFRTAVTVKPHFFETRSTAFEWGRVEVPEWAAPSRLADLALGLIRHL